MIPEDANRVSVANHGSRNRLVGNANRKCLARPLGSDGVGRLVVATCFHNAGDDWIRSRTTGHQAQRNRENHGGECSKYGSHMDKLSD